MGWVKSSSEATAQLAKQRHMGNGRRQGPKQITGKPRSTGCHIKPVQLKHQIKLPIRAGLRVKGAGLHGMGCDAPRP
jgi:hypothetical protein